jgi:hypothetical protein
VAIQRLSGTRPSPVTADSIHDLMCTLGCLQLDPTAIVARHDLLEAGEFEPRIAPRAVSTLLVSAGNLDGTDARRPPAAVTGALTELATFVGAAPPAA